MFSYFVLIFISASENVNVKKFNQFFFINELWKFRFLIVIVVRHSTVWCIAINIQQYIY